jgi:quinol monooxygenase YgiN
MIIVAGTLTVDPAQVDAFEAAVQAMVGAVREEDGCIQYSLLVEDRATGVINVLELWESEEALKTHLQLDATVNFFNRFSPHLTGMTAQLYDAENARSVPM